MFHAPDPRPSPRRRLAGRILLGCLLALAQLRAAPPPRSVRVGIFPNAPATYLDDQGQAQGFLVDMLREVAEREHWQLQFVPGSWHDGLDRLRTGDLDLLPSVAYTPERDAYLTFGKVPAFTMWSILYTHPGSGIQSILDVRNRRVGIMLGDINSEHFRQLCARFNISCRLEAFGDLPEVMAAVAAGRVDAGVLPNTYGYAHEAEYRVERTPVMFDPFDIYFAAPEGRHQDLLDALDRYLAAGKQDPASSYHRILDRWLVPVQGHGLPRWVGRTGLAVLALLALALVTVGVFRLRVRRATAEIRQLAAGLEQELENRRLLERLILGVADGVGVSTGETFLQDLVRNLAQALKADIAYVGERVREEGTDLIRTLALFQDGGPRDNVAWAVAGSPSARVLEEGILVCPNGMGGAFPGDAGIQETGIESYVGSALRDSSGRILGLVAVLHRQPLANPSLTASLLRIFSSRASAELERRQVERERLDLERQVQHAQKLESLGVLAGGIAHDFNNLLTAMLGHLNVAQLRLAPESPAVPHLESLERIIHRASDLTRQMLAYSGRGRFVVRPCDLNLVVREMTHLLEVSISKKIALRFDLAESLPPIQADVAQVQQVIMNLVTNASDAIGDQDGTIRLGTSASTLDRGYLDQLFQGQELAPGTFVSLEVSDTGCGMSPEVMARIFEPFFTTKVTGRGLGLSATMGILKGHRAGMKIYSEEGRGTTFRLLFPAVAAEAGSEPAREDPGPGACQGTVLLVDDERMIRESAAAALESLGFKVVPACDGREAVEVFRARGDIDLVLMDLTMPHMDGREAFQLIRRIRADVPVILSSGYNQQESVQSFLGRGLAGFLQKPYTLRALGQAVRDALVNGPGGPGASRGTPLG